VKYITIATIVIGGGDLGGATPDLTNPARDMVCGGITDYIGNNSPIFNGFDTIGGTWNAIDPDHPVPTYCGTFLPSSGPCH
jgi:hypothetical protein